jgi:uncharacterized protein (DUF58 family)
MSAGAAEAAAIAAGREPVPEEFHYRISWRAAGTMPGAHASRSTGPGVDFHGHASLLHTTDPRRFDVLATIRDPQRNLRLRVYRQLGSVPVTVLLDVSASMLAASGGSLALVADFVASLGFSAARTGDSFGVIACDEGVRRDLLLPHTRRRGAGIVHARRLRGLVPEGRAATGLLDGVNYLPRQRGLVFLVSDFHLPADQLNRLLGALGAHDVVPVPIWHEGERTLPRFGLLRLRDAETGVERLLFMRPGLAARVRATVQGHRDEVLAICRRHGRRPLMLGGEFSAQTVSRYFHG